MHRIALGQLAFLATSVHAFFPYIPNYACTQFHGCGDQSKRDAEPAELLTFKLSQRISPVCIAFDFPDISRTQLIHSS